MPKEIAGYALYDTLVADIVNEADGDLTKACELVRTYVADPTSVYCARLIQSVAAKIEA